VIEFVFGDAVARDGVKNREFDLFVVGVEVDEEVVNLVDHFRRARVLAVDLVDDDDGLELLFEGFRQDVARLRQRPFRSVYKQQRAVDHRQHALDLAPEIGVARRVEDVDLVIAVAHRGVFSHDRDAALALQVHRVHDALDYAFVGPEQPRLFEHRVYERGLAVVNVRDNGDVANFV
jgi:hypothetical protein